MFGLRHLQQKHYLLIILYFNIFFKIFEYLFVGTDEMIENALREMRGKINDQVRVYLNHVALNL